MNDADLIEFNAIEANLDSVDIKRYLDVNYDKLCLFKRALTVFRSSYFGYESAMSKSYELKFREYVQLMKHIFEQDTVDIDKLLEEIDKDLENSELFVIKIRIGDCKIDDKLTNPRLVIDNCIDNVSREIIIKREDNQFRSNVISLKVKFSQVKLLRVEKKELQIEFHAEKDNNSDYVLPRKLKLPYLSIHPEGYRTWFSFDTGVECLVVIQFSVKSPYSGSRISLTEHTQFIWHLFKYRFSKNRKKSKSDDQILKSHHNFEKKTSSLHQEVNPNSIDAFWPSKKNRQIATDMDILAISNPHASTMVHCHELELAYNETDEPIEEEFCRCSEWCNMSSFYFHNPILRFLMVQFTNYYIRTNANLPSSYMCAISYLFSESSKIEIPVSLLYVLNSILSYMKLSYSKKIQFLVIDVCSYKFMRRVDVNNLVKISENKEAFDTEVIGCINSYFQIFMYLHSHLGKMHQIVPNKSIDVWYDVLYEIIYRGYNSYLITNSHMAFSSLKKYSDIQLFYHFKYSTKSANYDYDMDDVIEERDKLYSNQHNQLNVKFNCHPFIQILTNISKFIVEIYHPLANSEKKTQKCHFAIKFDKLLTKQLASITNIDNNEEQILVYLAEIDDPIIENYRKKMHMIFTLKLYSLAFVIQQYLTSSLISYNRAACYGYWMHLPINLKFVFNSDWIERNYLHYFPMERLFADQCSKLEETITFFYKTIWRECSLNLTDENNLHTAILQEYFKLCLWWKINGKNFNIFRKLLETHQKMLQDFIVRADNLFTFEFSFIDSMKSSLCQVNHLVKDKIALNLVEAVCFCLVKVSCSLIRSVHVIQNEDNLKNCVSLTLAQPGIIDLISSLDTVLKCLNQLKILFIAYNDQFDFISRSISSTQYTIISLYRDLYVKLSWEWFCLVENFIEKATSKKSLKLNAILHFILVVGVHFIVRFYRHFRHDYCEFRKKVYKFDEKLQEIKGFDFDKYKRQIDEILKCEINSTGSMPFLSEPLETKIMEALGISLSDKTPLEYLKQFKIDIDKLQ